MNAPIRRAGHSDPLERWGVQISLVAGLLPLVLAPWLVLMLGDLLTASSDVPPDGDVMWRLGWAALVALGVAVVVLTPVMVAVTVIAARRWHRAAADDDRRRWRARAELGALMTVPCALLATTAVLLVRAASNGTLS